MIWCQSFVMFFFIIKIVYITFICVILVWSFILGTLFSITWLQMVIRTLRNITCYQQTTTSRGVISVQGGSWVRPIFQCKHNSKCKVQILFSKLISLYWSYSNSSTWDTLQYVTKACRKWLEVNIISCLGSWKGGPLSITTLILWILLTTLSSWFPHLKLYG